MQKIRLATVAVLSTTLLAGGVQAGPDGETVQ